MNDPFDWVDDEDENASLTMMGFAALAGLLGVVVLIGGLGALIWWAVK